MQLHTLACRVAVLTSLFNSYVRHTVLREDHAHNRRGHLKHFSGQGPLSLYEVICAVEAKARDDAASSAAPPADARIAALVYPISERPDSTAAGASLT